MFAGKKTKGFEEVDRSPVSLLNRAEFWQLEALKKLKKRMKWPNLHFRGKFLTEDRWVGNNREVL